MKPRERFLKALNGEATDVPAVGSPTSLATADLMAATGCFFPDVHHDAEQMATLAATAYEVLGYDAIAPYFSVVQEAAAMGAHVDWGDPGRMPAVRPSPATGRYLYDEPEQVDREVAYALQAGVAIIAPECAVPVTMDSRPLRRIVEAARGRQVRR